ncbi:apolipoprotein N-acyltransferase [Brevundimonas sp.]|uniref:apolipoprotein N-acyltransferase n=1 Tax=Brevundimonas sp. TaxID=1871086 RepID=UPI003566615A
MTHPTATLENDGPEDGPGARLILRFGRIGLALAAGAAAALAHPPFGVLPGLLGYALLMFLAERSVGARGAFWMGWLAGFAYFFISCWWVAEAFLVNPAQAWMAPFAASLLPIGLGLFWGTATALYRRFRPDGVRRVLVFAALFCLLEWLRGHVLTGFPWNPAGASWRAGSAASQFAAVVGVYGLGFVTVAGAAAFGPLLGAGSRKARIGAAVLGAAALGALVIGGAVRLSQARLELTDTVVRIVQADVPQESKWTPEAYQGIVDRYVNLTGHAGAMTPDLVIWPEGALPASANQVFAPGSADAEAIARAVQPGQSLIMGLGRGVPDPAAPGGGRYFNSLFVLTDEGAGGLRITATYDKYRLVPFGEYLPAGGLMGALGVRSLTHMPTDFSPGPVPAPIEIPGAPRAQPLICYESLYPGFTPGGGGRPGWIVNISNDAWFGRTSGPLQHLNLASYRAIETGLPVVRSTPTGVSAMIDPWGRIVGDQRLDPGESGVIDARLPRPVGVTPYGRLGDLLFWLAVLAGLALAAPWSWLRRRELPA